MRVPVSSELAEVVFRRLLRTEIAPVSRKPRRDLAGIPLSGVTHVVQLSQETTIGPGQTFRVRRLIWAGTSEVDSGLTAFGAVIVPNQPCRRLTRTRPASAFHARKGPRRDRSNPSISSSRPRLHAYPPEPREPSPLPGAPRRL
jgi:hypothetical protein